MINCLELVVKFVENILFIVNECKGELIEVVGNLRVLFYSWCWKLIEWGLRNILNCIYLVVYLLSLLEFIVKGGLGRLKYEIDEEILLYFRVLGFKWKDIVEFFFVLCWILWWWVWEFGIIEEIGFINIGNMDFDDIVGVFMNV